MQPGFPQQPYAPPPPKSGPSVVTIVLALIGGTVLLGFGSCVVCVGIGAGAASREGSTGAGAQRPVLGDLAPTPARGTAQAVELSSLLGEYKGNEVRADARFKGQWIRTTGTVGDIKKDILDSMYVTLGTGARFEFPMVQCFLTGSEAAKAASLNQGQSITVSGRVEGLMMNVLIKDCRIE